MDGLRGCRNNCIQKSNKHHLKRKNRKFCFKHFYFINLKRNYLNREFITVIIFKKFPKPSYPKAFICCDLLTVSNSLIDKAIVSSNFSNSL